MVDLVTGVVMFVIGLVLVLVLIGTVFVWREDWHRCQSSHGRLMVCAWYSFTMVVTAVVGGACLGFSCDLLGLI